MLLGGVFSFTLPQLEFLIRPFVLKPPHPAVLEQHCFRAVTDLPIPAQDGGGLKSW
jgi:hypothetical protein